MHQRYITRRALIARINRHLAKTGHQLFSSRSKADIATHGQGSYFIAEKHTGALVQGIASASELVAFARQKTLIKPAEALEVEKPAVL